MAKHVRDLLHGRAGINQTASQCVSQDMNSGALPTETPISTNNGCLHGSWTDGLPDRRNVPDEDLASLGLWAFIAEIIGDSLTGGRRQRQQIGTSRLASGNPDRASPSYSAHSRDSETSVVQAVEFTA